MNKLDWFKNELSCLTEEEQVALCNDYCDYIKKSRNKAYPMDVLTINNPSTYLSYHCDDIFECEDVWKKYIDDEDYINYLYEKLCDLKPDYMDCLVFLEIISNAEAFYISEDEIKAEVVKELKKQGVEL